MIERFKDADDEESWEKAQMYRQAFLDDIIDAQVFLSTHGVSWEASGAMPCTERLVAVEKFRKIDDARAKAAVG